MNRCREIGDREHAPRGGEVVRQPRGRIGHRLHDLEGAQCHQWKDGQHVTGEPALADGRDRDRQQDDDGDAGEADGKGGRCARRPRATACETDERLVIGQGPLEVLLVASESHEVRRSPEELDDVG
jgi:hypothetical protein